MSHFFGVVLVHKDTPKNGIHDAVSELVEKYNEQLDVEEYEKDCFCIGRVARNTAQEETYRRLGTPAELRDRFWKVHKQLQYPKEKPGMSKEEAKALWDAHNKAEKETDSAWKKANEPLQDLENRLFAQHPEAKKPNPKCEECHGTGKYKTTSNPDGNWDWWTVGGRWTGAFTPEYDASKDPRNLEKCHLCEGTGTRKVPVPVDPDWKPVKGDCNGCEGTGQRVKFSLAEHNGDIMPVSEVPKDVFPFSIVTPDGEWHERGKMGWFGMASDEKDEEGWHAEVASLFEKHKDCLAIVVDYHT